MASLSLPSTGCNWCPGSISPSDKTPRRARSNFDAKRDGCREDGNGVKPGSRNATLRGAGYNGGVVRKNIDRSGGKEPRGQARKRLMQAANGSIGLSRRFQRFRRRCEDLFPFVFFECFVVNSLLQSSSSSYGRGDRKCAIEANRNTDATLLASAVWGMPGSMLGERTNPIRGRTGEGNGDGTSGNRETFGQPDGGDGRTSPNRHVKGRSAALG